MIFRNGLILLFFLTFAAGSFPAMAKSKLWMYSWEWGHERWTSYKKFAPFLENGKHPHNAQWKDQNWYAEDWISQTKGSPDRKGLNLVDGFYKAGILKDQKIEDDIPVLVVGPQFYHLSGYDKRRVAHTVDVVYGITQEKENGVFILKDWRTKQPVGLYTEYGLQLQ